jgi:NAD(P)-dependent dehydrogenase (short-subunit alcohol dehydrogenase family)
MQGKTDAQRCLVTGANRGLGLELCRQLLAQGGQVIAACRHPGKGRPRRASVRQRRP